MIRLSASSVPRVLACVGSAVLPQHDYETKYADDGDARHAEMESAADVGDVDSLPDEVRALMLPGDKMAAEYAFAYDVATDTGRELGHIKRRAYEGLAPFELGGTIDLLIRGNGRTMVVDYKGYEAVAGAEDNMQGATYALMVARTYGLDEVTLVIVYLAAQRKQSIATLSSLDFDSHAQRLKRLQVDVARAAADPESFLAVGPQCKYCPAFLSCPRQHDLKLEVANEAMAMRVEGAIPFANDDDAADAFDLWQRVQTLSARIGAALYARSVKRPIPLKSGKMFGPVKKLGNRELDADKTYAIVRAKYGQEVADAAVRREASQTWITTALKAANVESAAKAKDEIVAELEKQGGVVRKSRTSIEEYDAVKQLRVVNE